MERLTELYKQMEEECDGDGLILDTDFVECVEKEDVKMQLALMGVHYTDGMNFFRLLDVNADKWLGIDEFVMGCMRLKAGALLIDSTVLIQDTKQMLKTKSLEQKTAMQAMNGNLQGISEKLEKMQQRARSHPMPAGPPSDPPESEPKRRDPVPDRGRELELSRYLSHTISETSLHHHLCQ
jgi:hypothetical protein